ncbi:MAG: response regulator transcription factor [Acidobacteriota bacterium]
MSRVLVVDDEQALRRVVRDALERDGHVVETAVDGREAVQLLDRDDYQLVITDLGMPRMDGLDLIRHIRKASTMPVIVLTVRADEREKVRLLDAGADDYVTKPFGVDELLARARALLRRAEPRPAAPGARTIGTLTVDLDARTVTRDGESIHLTPTEHAILAAFLQKPGGVWTHRQLLTAVWGTTAGVTNDTLRVHVGSLRRKIEADPARPRLIRTEPWVGYRFTPDA